MKAQTILTVESHDRTNTRHIMEAWNLVGGDKDGAKAAVKNSRTHDLDRDGLETKVMGKIGSNQFTVEDAEAAVRAIRRRRDELHESLNSPVFCSEHVQTVWADGVRMNSNRAVEMAETFLADLREDMVAC